MKKIHLLKTYGIVSIMGLSVALSTLKQTTDLDNIPYTSSDIENNKEYLKNLNIIFEDEPFFYNNDLYDYICKELKKDVLTEKDLDNIKSLKISTELSNNDFSDLKYLKNLKSLTIEKNTVDINNLKYNINLKEVTFNDCTIINTHELPNSIKSLSIVWSNVKDSNLYVPYHTTKLSLLSSFYNNITLKNPKGLRVVNIQGDSFLDLKIFEECPNLYYLVLERVTNVKNPNSLLNLNLDTLVLDDYAPIWMTSELFNQLPYNLVKNYKKLHNEMIELDMLANELAPYELSQDQKIKNIIVYILDKLEYDQKVIDKTDDREYLSKTYNEYPIQYALSGKGICINYASLFQALTNRSGIETYSLFSDTHTWNEYIINGKKHLIDPTFLDSEAIYLFNSDNTYFLAQPSFKSSQEEILVGNEKSLYYYDFDYYIEKQLGDDSHVPNLIPVESKKNINIGYVPIDKYEEDYIVKINGNLYRANKYELTLKLIIALMLIKISYTSKSLINSYLPHNKIKLHEKALKLRNKKY